MYTLESGKRIHIYILYINVSFLRIAGYIVCKPLHKENIMANCIELLPHKCGSSDALQVFEQDGVYSAYCFACNTYEPKPYGDVIFSEHSLKPKVKIKTPEEIDNEIKSITLLKHRNLPDRKLMASTLQHFGIRVGVSEQDGSTPATHFYPYYSGNALVGYKCRVVENKKMFAIGTTSKADLFNWKNAVATGAPRLYITEGELDACSVYQAIVKKICDCLGNLRSIFV